MPPGWQHRMQHPFWFTLQRPLCWPGSKSLYPTGNSGIWDSHCHTHFSGYEELLTSLFYVFGFGYVFFYEPHWHKHLSSVHLSVIVGPYGWHGLAFLAPNTSWNEIESSVICLVFRVILYKLRSDGLLTVANVKIMAVFRVRWE